ncbi:MULTISPECIES: aminoglycoside phosphotransferase family protein [unclassified Ruegeria]|uniref:aminoglycoside phosphotransferase family protein n=1 Tax=unclassified Ruegeria TaxID=2625375 RepID=UPI001488DB1D|nr:MULTISPECIES: aminoglycoside phosphotransferase family protein [unclassified Ruegeria]NOD63018.1 phosphotransferase [Ruegeria sp. HKCCD6109]
MPSTCDEFLDEWNLQQPELVAETGQAQVWKVLSKHGPAALKLYRRPDRGNEAPGSALLNAWRDRGAVRIFNEERSAVLMEWLDGPSLGDIARSGRPDDTTRILAETAARLHGKASVRVQGLRPLDQVFTPLFNCAFAPTCPTLLRNDVLSAMAMGRHLLKSQLTPVPLHGDLHPDNIIMTDAGPRVFDAKGYIGDPAFELANALRHPKGMRDLVRDPRQIETCLSLYSKALKVPKKRLAQWAAAKCALSIYWRSDGAIDNDPEADLLNLLLYLSDQ